MTPSYARHIRVSCLPYRVGAATRFHPIHGMREALGVTSSLALDQHPFEMMREWEIGPVRESSVSYHACGEPCSPFVVAIHVSPTLKRNGTPPPVCHRAVYRRAGVYVVADFCSVSTRVLTVSVVIFVVGVGSRILHA